MPDGQLFLFHYTDPLDPDTFDLLLGHTGPLQRKKILSFRIQTDVERSLLGFILSKYVGMKYYGCPENIRMGVGEHGKPFYIDQDHYHFNISHSGSWVICAAGSSPVGCDVQLKKKVNLDVAKRFFHPDEYQTLSELHEQDRENYFFTLWVLKESYIKALGKGFTHGMGSYYFDIEDREKIRLVTGMNGGIGWDFSLHHLDPLHSCAVCFSGITEKNTVLTVNDRDLSGFFKSF